MLDIKLIRQNPKAFKEGIQKKGAKPGLVDQVLKLDEQKRKLIIQIESLRAEQKKLGKEDIKKAQGLKGDIKKLSPKMEKIETELRSLMFQLPNLPLAGVPVKEEVVREVGKKPKFSFKPKDYLEIGESLDLIDIKRAAKVAGTRFGFLKKEAALLEFALVNLALDTLVKEGFIPVVPPVMLKSEMVKGMGYLEQIDKEEAYYFPPDDLYLAGTSEQSLGTMHAEEVFAEKDLPRRYVAFSSCFRREAGSYGKDTKGIFRVHQFDKVEMFSFVKPGDSQKEHKFLLSLQEKLMKALNLPYRIVNIASSDLGVPAVQKYDIEAWLPAESCYRETQSASNCTDFQARRLNVKYKDTKTNKLEFVHTLNGTAFSQRPLIAILENFQQKDGSIKIPKQLHKYLPFKEIKA